MASENGRIWAIDPEGSDKQEFDSGDLPSVTTPLVWAGDMCFAGTRDGTLVAVDIASDQQMHVLTLGAGDIEQGSVGVVSADGQSVFWPSGKRLLRIAFNSFQADGVTPRTVSEREPVVEAESDLLLPTVSASCVYVAERYRTIHQVTADLQTTPFDSGGRIHRAPCWNQAERRLYIRVARDDGSVVIRACGENLNVSTIKHLGPAHLDSRTELLYISDSAGPRQDMLVWGTADPRINHAQCLSGVSLGVNPEGEPVASQPVDGELTAWLAYSAPARMLFATTTKGSLYGFQISEH